MYDEDSFLAGLAVGQKLKGWGVIDIGARAIDHALASATATHHPLRPIAPVTVEKTLTPFVPFTAWAAGALIPGGGGVHVIRAGEIYGAVTPEAGLVSPVLTVSSEVHGVVPVTDGAAAAVSPAAGLAVGEITGLRVTINEE